MSEIIELRVPLTCRRDIDQNFVDCCPHTDAFAIYIAKIETTAYENSYL